MTKAEYKEARRWYRIVRNLASEQFVDVMIYGASYQIVDDTGIFNIPPAEVVIGPDNNIQWIQP
jgi:hypothetical protein